MHHLHHAFAIAVNKGFLQTNPVEAKSKKRNPSNGAEPYSADELKRLRENANDNLFIFLFLRWTGFRRSDATILTWADIDFDCKEIEHVCKKTKRSTGKKVIIPIAQELMAALEGELTTLAESEPSRVDRFCDWSTLQQARLGGNDRYNALTYRIQVLGEHAGVTDAGPHRFRDTFAVDMLLRTDNLDYVADLLGDTVKTVKEYYLPFVRELRERVRFHLDNGKGIEQFETPASQTSKSAA